MSAIPVLSMWQPWASLMVLINPETGLPWKTIETRSWRTRYRGRLAIQAAARQPQRADLHVGEFRVRGVGSYAGGAWVLEGPGLPAYRSTPRFEGYVLPFGAIVATCTLVDVVPMVDHAESGDPECVVVHDDGLDHCIPSDDPQPLPAAAPGIHTVRLDPIDIKPGALLIRDVSDQLPYGLFKPGRFAWMPADVVPVDPPVRFKGGQGLSRRWEAA